MRHQTILPAIPQDHRSLERYLSELKKIELITAEEEIRLARQIHGRGSETLANQALEQLVRANLRFVVSVAKQYQHYGLPLMDLISEGNIGLMQAARRFDETKGFKFISYAVWWIRKSILEAISEYSRRIRLPRARVEDYRALENARARLEQELEREPSLEELAEATGQSLAEIRITLGASQRQASLHAPLEVEYGYCLLDVIEDLDADLPDAGLLDADPLNPDLERMLACLKKRERVVLGMWYGVAWGMEPRLKYGVNFGAGGGEFRIERETLSYAEIGKRLGIGASRVQQLKQRALLKLKVLMCWCDYAHRVIIAPMRSSGPKSGC